MAKLPTRRPTQREINRAVFGGLSTRQGITSAMVPYVVFQPTLGITAGRINKLGFDIRSFRVPLKRAIKEVVIPSIRTNFDVGGRPPWEPLSEGTEEIRERMGDRQSKSPLVKSGALRRAMGYQNLWNITSTFAILPDIPGHVWYGKLHQAGYEGSASMGRLIRQFGGDRRAAFEHMIGNIVSGNAPTGGVSAIPARPFVMLQPEDEDRITEIFIEWLGERIDAAWPVGV